MIGRMKVNVSLSFNLKSRVISCLEYEDHVYEVQESMEYGGSGVVGLN